MRVWESLLGVAWRGALLALVLGPGQRPVLAADAWTALTGARLALAVLAQDPTSAAGEKALRALGDASPEELEVAKQLLRKIAPVVDGDRQLAAWLALATFGDSAAGDALSGVLVRTTDERHRKLLAGHFRFDVETLSLRAAEWIASAPAGKFDEELVETALRALRRHSIAGDARARALLARLLSDDSGRPEDRRTQALLALRSVAGSTEPLPPPALEALLALEPGKAMSAQSLWETWRTALTLATNDDGKRHEDAKLAMLAGRALGRLLQKHGDELQVEEPLVEIDETERRFAGPARPYFRAALREKLNAPGGDDDPCEAACRLAEGVAGWAKRELHDVPADMNLWDRKNAAGWKHALASYGALFLVKATAACPKARAALEEFAKLWADAAPDADADSKKAATSPPPPPDPKAVEAALRAAGVPITAEIRETLARLAGAADAVHPSKDAPENPLASYGNLFGGLFLDELLGNEALRAHRGDGATQARLRETLARLHNQLARFGRGLDPKHDLGSSWQTYLLAAAAVGTANHGFPSTRRAMRRLRQLRTEAAHPCAFPYDAKLKYGGKAPPTPPRYQDEDFAESAPRSVTASLALYLDRGGGKTEAAAKADREGLLEAIGCFTEHGWRAAAQLGAHRAFHSQRYIIGSHYLYPNLPFIAAAIRRLLSDPALSDEQRRLLEQHDRRFRGFLLGLRKDGKSFRRMGSEGWLADSPAYVSPSVGLALLSYCPVKAGAEPPDILPRGSFTPRVARSLPALAAPEHAPPK